MYHCVRITTRRVHIAQCTHWPAIKYNAICSPNLFPKARYSTMVAEEQMGAIFPCHVQSVNSQKRADCTCKSGSCEYHSEGVRGVIGINRSLPTLREVSRTNCGASRRSSPGCIPLLLGTLDVDTCRKCCPITHMSWHEGESAGHSLIAVPRLCSIAVPGV